MRAGPERRLQSRTDGEATTTAKKKLGMTDHLDLNLKFELVGTHTELDLPKAPDFQARSKCELSMKVRSGGPPERRRSPPGRPQSSGGGAAD